MLGHQIKDETDGRRGGGSPLMSWFQKHKPSWHHHSASPDGSPKSQRQRKVGERLRGQRDSGTSSVGSDEEELGVCVRKTSSTVASSRPSSVCSQDDDKTKSPGNGDIVSLVSKQSKQNDGMLRVTSEPWGYTGQQGETLYKVDCKGQYSDQRTKFVWSKPSPTIDKHENCLGAYLSMVNPSKEGEPCLRLCCLKMKDGKIVLAAHKVSADPEELLYVCYHKDRGGVITLQENVSHIGKPLDGYFIGATSNGELQMFPRNLYEPYTSNPFADFYIMDLDDKEMDATKRMNGEK